MSMVSLLTRTGGCCCGLELVCMRLFVRTGKVVGGRSDLLAFCLLFCQVEPVSLIEKR